jgi:hypothetical protein
MTTAQRFYMREVYSLDEGPVQIVWPSLLSENSVCDLEAHLQQFIAKLRRVSMEKTVPPAATTSSDSPDVAAARNTENNSCDSLGRSAKEGK